jgi:hypothetical protein
MSAPDGLRLIRALDALCAASRLAALAQSRIEKAKRKIDRYRDAQHVGAVQ